MWNQVTIVGVGLLGGSLGLALQQRGLARRVVGLVRREASRAECLRLGVVQEATLEEAAAVRAADLVVLGTPVLQMRALSARLAPHLKRGAVVTDVGSVKSRLVADLEARFRARRVHFVGSHPMAGGEQMGPGAARADLFAGAQCVVTPTAHTSRAALRKVEALWQAVGGRTLRLAPAAHDALVARASHLPHVAAAVLAGLVLGPAAPAVQAQLCATGFRDTTRVASGSPEMWRDIVLENQEPLDAALAEYLRELRAFRRLARRGDAQRLLQFFTTAKERRDQWLAAMAASPSPE